MSLVKDPTRRTLLKGAGGLAALAGIGAPAIVKAQADAIRIGHLTPRTGFLGPLGEYAVMAVQMAADEVNAGGGVMGRKIELLIEDSVNPQTASAKAERFVERDKVGGDRRRDFVRLGARDRAGRAARQGAVHQHRLQLRRAARLRLQEVHVPHRGRELDVREGRRAGHRQDGARQGQEVVLAHGRLRLRPRSPEGGEAFHGVEGRPVRRGRAGADGRHRLLGLLAQNPAGAARSRGGATSPARRSPTSSSSIPSMGCSSRSPASASTPRSPGAPARAISRAPGRWSGITSSTRPRRKSSSRTSPSATASRPRTRPGATTTRSRFSPRR